MHDVGLTRIQNCCRVRGYYKVCIYMVREIEHHPLLRSRMQMEFRLVYENQLAWESHRCQPDHHQLLKAGPQVAK